MDFTGGLPGLLKQPSVYLHRSTSLYRIVFLYVEWIPFSYKIGTLFKFIRAHSSGSPCIFIVSRVSTDKRVDLLQAGDNYYWPTNLHLREPLLVFCCSENIHYFICIQWPGAKKYWSVNGYHERIYESSL